jgi:hypothetical protein
MAPWIAEYTKKFYLKVKSEKQPVWGRGCHFFYYVSPKMMHAVDAVVPFMRKHFDAANGNGARYLPSFRGYRLE